MISESSHGDPWNRLRSVRWAARVASLSLGLIGLLAIVAFARMVGPPPRTSTIDASAWLLSCIGAALMAYLTAIIVLGLLARVGPWDGAIRALDRVTIAPIRRLLDAAIGGAFALAVVGGPAGASSSVPSRTFRRRAFRWSLASAMAARRSSCDYPPTRVPRPDPARPVQSSGPKPQPPSWHRRVGSGRP